MRTVQENVPLFKGKYILNHPNVFNMYSPHKHRGYLLADITGLDYHSSVINTGKSSGTHHKNLSRGLLQWCLLSDTTTLGGFC
jgi:hypothetical protein